MTTLGIEDILGALPQKKDLAEFRNSAPLILYRRALSAVVAVLDARDPYTAHHSERVSLMAGSFAEIMHFPLYLRSLIATAGIVHDIGKVGVPDAILYKSGRLTDGEWAVMKQHPVISARIILEAGELSNIAEAARSHHERWDGKGYPDGLAGRQIPYISRMIALCDSTDAMMSSRVYRPSLGPDACKKELAANSGTMYQPELTDIFLQNWDRIAGGLYENIDPPA